jgi:chromate reductase, NAD(P)H dehydrogenase (quinone)
MTEAPIRILAISGSLRAASINTAVLTAAIALCPDSVEITLYQGLNDLPHFNPDLEEAYLPSVIDFGNHLQSADAVLICSPEYAHGVPGVLKNALDWVVGSGEFMGKPVALLNASPRATHAQASLIETLTTMDARVVTDACIALPLLGRGLDASGIAADPDIALALQTAIATLASRALPRR